MRLEKSQLAGELLKIKSMFSYNVYKHYVNIGSVFQLLIKRLKHSWLWKKKIKISQGQNEPTVNKKMSTREIANEIIKFCKENNIRFGKDRRPGEPIMQRRRASSVGKELHYKECEHGQIVLARGKSYDLIRTNNKVFNEFLAIPKIHGSIRDNYPALKYSEEAGTSFNNQRTSSSVIGFGVTFNSEHDVRNFFEANSVAIEK